MKLKNLYNEVKLVNNIPISFDLMKIYVFNKFKEENEYFADGGAEEEYRQEYLDRIDEFKKELDQANNIDDIVSILNEQGFDREEAYYYILLSIVKLP